MSSFIHEILSITIMYDFQSYCRFFLFFMSNLFDYWFPYCIGSHLYCWSTQQVTVAHHMRCFFMTSYSPMFFLIYYFNFIHKGRWFPFSFHIWSAIFDFSIPPTTLLKYTQFLFMLNSVRNLTRLRYFRRAVPLLKIFLISYGLHIF